MWYSIVQNRDIISYLSVEVTSRRNHASEFIRTLLLLFLSSSSSIGTATLVGFGLLNFRRVFSAGRFLQSAVASGT